MGFLQVETAFKEWASVVQALGSARQSVILRKGGIHEGKGGFKPDHDAFVLYPTFEHQNPADLKIPLVSAPAEGGVVGFFARVSRVYFVNGLNTLNELESFHVWSKEAVLKKFQTGRQAGLTVMTLRVYALKTPVSIPWHTSYDGCKSWITLKTPLHVELGPAVMAENDFARMDEAVNRLCTRSK